MEPILAVIVLLTALAHLIEALLQLYMAARKGKGRNNHSSKAK